MSDKKPTQALAHEIVVDQDTGSVTIDGTPFPWYLHAGIPIQVDMIDADGSIAAVCLPVLAETVHVIRSKEE